MIEIVYEDEFLMVVNKPVGLSSQKEERNSLVSELELLTGKTIYPVHRLDQMVSGLIIYARDSRTAARLSKAIADDQVDKSYLAVTDGVLQQEKGTLRDLLFYDRRKNKSFVVNRERNGVKEAILTYQLLEKTEEKSLVKVHLLTGRTHQIRIQFANQGHPLAGDGKYGSRDNHCTIALHSYQLTFKHPVSNRMLYLTSYPQWVYPWNLFAPLNKDD